MVAYEKKFLARNGKYLTRGDKCILRERSKLFVMLVDTTLAGSAPDTMIIPTISTGHSGYDCTVDWGDGIVDTYTGSAPVISHTYAAGGEKTIKISGTFPRIYFNNTGDKAKLLSILNWGNYGIGVSDQQSAFFGCVNNTFIAEDWKLDEWLTDGTLMFFNNQLTQLPTGMTLNALIIGNVMFFNNQLTQLPTGMTLSALTSGSSMFDNNQLTQLPTGMTLSALTSGAYMFFNNQLTQLPTGMTLSALTSGNHMFRNNQLTQLPTGMTLSALTSGSSMFVNNQLTQLPTGMTLSALTNGSSMFRNNQLTQLPTGMTLSALTSGNHMFRNNQLTQLPTGMTLSALTNGSSMFLGNTINTTDYSQLLVNIAANNVNTGVTFHGGNSKYNASGETARNQLTVNQSWSITDGGLEI